MEFLVIIGAVVVALWLWGALQRWAAPKPAIPSSKPIGRAGRWSFEEDRWVASEDGRKDN